MLRHIRQNPRHARPVDPSDEAITIASESRLLSPIGGDQETLPRGSILYYKLHRALDYALEEGEMEIVQMLLTSGVQPVQSRYGSGTRPPGRPPRIQYKKVDWEYWIDITAKGRDGLKLWEASCDLSALPRKAGRARNIRTLAFGCHFLSF